MTGPPTGFSGTGGDQLHADAFVSDATWKALGERYDRKQLMDVVFAVGQYNLVSMALNTLGVQLDAGVRTFEETVGREPAGGGSGGQDAR